MHPAVGDRQGRDHAVEAEAGRGLLQGPDHADGGPPEAERGHHGAEDLGVDPDQVQAAGGAY